MKKYSVFLLILALFVANKTNSETNELYKEDISACFRLVNVSISSSQEELNANRSIIEDYIKLVDKYPSDKKEYLRKATINYIYYILSGLYDLDDYNIDYIIDTTKKYQTSDRTKKFKAAIEKYSASEQSIKIYSKVIEDEIEKLPKVKTFQELPKDKQIELMTTIAIQEESIVRVQQRASRMYQTIFRERFPKPEWATLEWLP